MIKILICDDSQHCLENNEKMIREILKDDLNYEIRCYTDPKYIREWNFDIAILDIELQEQTGITLAEKIKEHNNYVSIIFITNYDTFTKEAYSILADGYLTKPVKEEQLRALLKKSITYILGVDKGQSVLQFYSQRRQVILKQKNIMYIERVGRKVIVAATQSEYSIIKSLTELEEDLEDFFVKINQGIIVNMFEIVNMDKTQVYLANGKVFKMSRGLSANAKDKYLRFRNR